MRSGAGRRWAALTVLWRSWQRRPSAADGVTAAAPREVVYFRRGRRELHSGLQGPAPRGGRRAPAARAVPGRRLPGADRRADAPYAAGGVGPDRGGRGRRARVDVGGVSGAAERDLHGRHPLRHTLVEAPPRV